MQSNFFSTTSNIESSNNTNDNLIINIPPIASETKKYWCHLCKKEFSQVYDDSIDIECVFCGKTFCELLENDDISNESHPMHFQPYVLQNNSNEVSDTNNDNNNSRSNIRRHSNFIIFNSFSMPSPFIPSFIRSHLMYHSLREDNIDNIINEIMLNDPNKYGNPPASQKAVEKLQKCKINEDKIKEFGIENSCAVCKDEFTIGEECLLMPCSHHFHGDCLLPWLKERNSCPVCRYELPTDDEDFELRKKMKNNSGNNISEDNNIHS